MSPTTLTRDEAGIEQRGTGAPGPSSPTVEGLLESLGGGDYVAKVLETYRQVMEIYGPTQAPATTPAGGDGSVNGYSTTTNIPLR